LRLHGSERAWVVHGGGIDELTTTDTSVVLALDEDMVRTFTIDPVALGFAPAIPDELVGGTPPQNAEYVRRVMKGEHGAHRNIVVLNAAAGLVVAGVADSMEEGIIIATNSIDEGHASRTLDRWILESQAAAAELAG
jgi:anthranilate phosphoribosyltransferase